MIFSQPRKQVTQSFTFFENKNYTIKISFSMKIVELFTLHLMVYSVFVEYGDIRGNDNWKIKTCTKKIQKDVVFESCNSSTSQLYPISQNNGDYLR